MKPPRDENPVGRMPLGTKAPWDECPWEEYPLGRMPLARNPLVRKPLGRKPRLPYLPPPLIGGCQNITGWKVGGIPDDPYFKAEYIKV